MNLLSSRQRSLFHHWRSLRRDGEQFPTRDRFDPVDVPQILSMLMLLDWEEPGWRIRVVGTEIVEMTGADHTGQLVSEVLSGDYHDYIHHLYENCREKKVPIVSNSRFQWDLGREMETVRLLLPLGRQGATDTVAHILNAQLFLHDKTGPRHPVMHEVLENAVTEHSHRLVSIDETDQPHNAAGGGNMDDPS